MCACTSVTLSLASTDNYSLWHRKSVRKKQQTQIYAVCHTSVLIGITSAELAVYMNTFHVCVGLYIYFVRVILPNRTYIEYPYITER
jgi:hypothetical protein